MSYKPSPNMLLQRLLLRPIRARCITAQFYYPSVASSMPTPRRQFEVKDYHGVLLEFQIYNGYRHRLLLPRQPTWSYP